MATFTSEFANNIQEINGDLSVNGGQLGLSVQINANSDLNQVSNFNTIHTNYVFTSLNGADRVFTMAPIANPTSGNGTDLQIGYSCLIVNEDGSNSITINNSSAGLITTVASGESTKLIAKAIADTFTVVNFGGGGVLSFNYETLDSGGSSGPVTINNGDTLRFNTTTMQLDSTAGVPDIIDIELPNCYPVKLDTGATLSVGDAVGFDPEDGDIINVCSFFKVVDDVITELDSGTLEYAAHTRDSNGKFYVCARVSSFPTAVIKGTAFNENDLLVIIAQSDGTIDDVLSISDTNINSTIFFDLRDIPGPIGDVGSNFIKPHHYNNNLYVFFAHEINGAGTFDVNFIENDGSTFATISTTSLGSTSNFGFITQIDTTNNTWSNVTRVTREVISPVPSNSNGVVIVNGAIDESNDKIYVICNSRTDITASDGLRFPNSVSGDIIVPNGDVDNTNTFLTIAEFDIAEFGFTWVNTVSSNVISPDIFGRDIISFNNEIVISATVDVDPASTFWNRTYTASGSTAGPGITIAQLNNNYGLLWRIDKSNGNPIWYRQFRSSNAGVTASGILYNLTASDTQLYFRTNGDTNNTNPLQWVDPSTATIENTFTPVGIPFPFPFTFNTLLYGEVNIVDGTIVNSGLLEVNISSYQNNDILYCNFDNKIYSFVAGGGISSGDFYNGSALNFSEPSVTVFILNPDLTPDENNSRLTPSVITYYSCDNLGIYSGQDTGTIIDGVTSTGTIFRWNNQPFSIYGLMEETAVDGDINKKVCIAGKFQDGSLSLTPGQIYYWDCSTNSLTTTYIRNGQVGYAVASDTIIVQPIRSDLTGQVNAESLSTEGGITITTNAQIGGTLSVDTIKSQTNSQHTYEQINTILYTNNNSPTKLVYFTVNTAGNTAVPPTSAVGSTLVRLDGPLPASPPNSDVGTITLVDLAELISNFNVNNVSNIRTYTFDIKFTMLEDNTLLSSEVASYHVRLVVLYDDRTPSPSDVYVRSSNVISSTSITGDTLAYYVGPVNDGAFTLRYTQSSGTNVRLVQGSVEIFGSS